MRLIQWVGTRPQNLKGRLINEALKSLGWPWVCYDSGQHTDPHLAQPLASAAPRTHLSFSEGDVMIVEGDTRTALEGALWAHAHGAKLIHVEAGCRAPLDLPEQHARIIIDHLADYRYCVSEQERLHCLEEGCDPLTTTVIGDLTWELFQRTQPESVSLSPHTILLTLHRHDVTPPIVRMILATLRNYGQVIFPAHPRIYPWVKDEVGVIPSVSYPVLRGYLDACEVVATDSGGLCREAFMAYKPCVILRTATEWTQLVDCGRHRIVGHHLPTLAKALEDPWPETPVKSHELFGEHPLESLIDALHRDLS